MKTSFMKIILLCAVAIGFNLVSFAASPGALDFSFSNDGKVTTNVSISTVGSDVLVQPDGKILVVGTTNLGVSGTAFFVARYNQTGALDTTFNLTGVVIVDYGSVSEADGELALQPDGKILFGGSISLTESSDDLVVTRLNSDGTLDVTFAGDGKATFSTTPIHERLADIDVTPAGNIVVTVSLNSDFGLLQITSSGILDSSFSGDGILFIDIGKFAQASAIQPDGKIIVVGSGRVIGTPDIAFGVARVNTNGTLDTTFSIDGVTTITFLDSVLSRALSVAIQPNGKIVVAGDASSKSAISRLNTNGTLDTTFDSDGKFTIDIDARTLDLMVDIEILPSGKILTLFRVVTNFFVTTNKFGVIGFNSVGSLDNSFGQAGIFQMNEFGSQFAIQSDGKFVVVGTVVNQNRTLLLTRHTANIQPTQESDFDGDAFTDSAVYRPSTGNWFILNSATNTVTIDQFGANGDVPIGGDFDGDGKSDVSIYRPSVGEWYFKRSSDNTVTGATFGGAGDKPIAGDYDKDGKTDIAFFRPGNGNWFVLRSSTNFSTFFAYPFGQVGDIPISIAGS
jgi:uncharacterized delta-60 repeat protein